MGWRGIIFKEKTFSRGLNGAKDNDLIIVSDLDEIPNLIF